jgi:hypothetical protein
VRSPELLKKDSGKRETAMSIKRKILAAATTMLLVTGIAVASGTTPAFG